MDDTATCPGFRLGHIIILDWYDRPLQVVARCDASSAWYYCWLVTWAPSGTSHYYALKVVRDAWVSSLRDIIGAPPHWPKWSPQLDADRWERVNERVKELFVAPQERVFLARFSDLGAVPESCCEVSAAVLGPHARPLPVEVLVEQSTEQRLQIETICDGEVG